MPHFIADAIRAHIDDPQPDADRALLAVLDKCEAVRTDSTHYTATERGLAEGFERVIVRSLNVAFPVEQVGELRTFMRDAGINR